MFSWVYQMRRYLHHWKHNCESTRVEWWYSRNLSSINTLYWDTGSPKINLLRLSRLEWIGHTLWNYWNMYKFHIWINILLLSRNTFGLPARYLHNWGHNLVGRVDWIYWKFDIDHIKPTNVYPSFLRKW